MDLSAGRQGLVLRVEMDVGTGVELECSYGAGDGWTRSGVVSMPKERSGGPRLDRSCDWEKYGYDRWWNPSRMSSSSRRYNWKLNMFLRTRLWWIVCRRVGNI